MKDRNYRHIVDILFVLGLFCVFVLSAIFLISVGADIYSDTMYNMDSNFNSRTAVAYITEKIHQSDKSGNIYVGSIDGREAIIIESENNDQKYYTYLYEYDHKLMELTVRDDIALGAAAGQKILDIEGLEIIRKNGSLIKCSIDITENETRDFYIAVHG